jgi:PspA-Associated protein
VIVRIATEGQYELPPDDEDTLQELDNQAAAACAADDEQQFHDAFGRLLEFVRTNGRPVPDDELAPSDVIVPPPDISLEEATAEFTGEGLIPG